MTRLLHSASGVASPNNTSAQRNTTLARLAKAALALSVTAATIVFLVRVVRATWTEFTTIVASPKPLLTAAWLSLAYGALFFILAGSWYLTLRQRAPGKVAATRGAYIYCVANAAKFLPGNVFHFAGRQILGSRAGWGHGAIAQATLLEIAAIVASILTMILAAAAFSPADAVSGILPDTWHFANAYRQSIGVAGLVTEVLVFAVLARSGAFTKLFGVPTVAVLRAIAMCALFFSLYAGLAILFAHSLPLDTKAPSALAIAIAYLSAWLAGFVVPGAPGGLGVRETALVLLLSGTGGIGDAYALGLGFGMRLVNTLGDLVAIGIAYAAIRYRPQMHPGHQAGHEANDG